MTKFHRENFINDGDYVHYVHEGERHFIGRFKYGSRRSFVTFLMKNFTVEEYIEEMQKTGAPLLILMEKGYVSDNIKKVLKRLGLPQTKEAYEAYLTEKCCAS